MKVKFEELFSHEYWNKKGYITGLGREFPHPKKAHLYRGSFANPEEPLCKRGLNRGDGYSIWRNNVGKDGICLICITKARKELSIKEAEGEVE